MNNYRLSHLEILESEAIFILREVAAEFHKPTILFSGGKDSIVMTHLAKKAFYPSKIPFPLLHIDTGHNFPETIAFRDSFVKDMQAKLIVASVEDTITKGKATEETGTNASRNTIQSVTLLDAIEEHKFDAAIGGGRRDEEKSRAKERIFSHRDEFGQWDPKNQRPELWNLFNCRKNFGEHFRVFPLSNWTELDVWQYIKKEKINVPSLYFSHERQCIERNGSILAFSEFIKVKSHETVKNMRIRFRTVGDLTITGALISNASNVEEIIEEVAKTNIAERGTRADDKRSDTAMEDRKKQGYF